MTGEALQTVAAPLSVSATHKSMELCANMFRMPSLCDLWQSKSLWYRRASMPSFAGPAKMALRVLISWWLSHSWVLISLETWGLAKHSRELNLVGFTILIGRIILIVFPLIEDVHPWIARMTGAMMQGAIADCFKRFPTMAKIVLRFFGGHIRRIIADTKINEQYSIELVERCG